MLTQSEIQAKDFQKDKKLQASNLTALSHYTFKLIVYGQNEL
jgi:hypothetical protein